MTSRTGENVFVLYEHFENEIRSEFGPTASYWNSYLDMVQTLLDYQQSLRTSETGTCIYVSLKNVTKGHA